MFGSRFAGLSVPTPSPLLSAATTRLATNRMPAFLLPVLTVLHVQQPMIALLALIFLPAEDPSATIASPAEPATATANTSATVDPFATADPLAVQTAVALNYCRTALHRIRSSPRPVVLREERDRILDNLSLDSIADPEVIRLYSALLDEIGQLELAGPERTLVQEGAARSIRRRLVWDSVAFAGQVATAQYAAALRTGADSWWDTRDRLDRRDAELLGLQRDRMKSVTEKSTLFLDTFWTLARRREIPDAWLVRGGDLDRLATAVAEPRDSVRQRRLARLQPFLQAYPPYWYHVARTQQALGQFDEAIETYDRLTTLEEGQFRIDEMLAAAETNWALLLEARGDASAAVIATRALGRAPDVWEANLAAAGVLERSGRLAAAEEALLRNIDAGRARGLSQTFRLAMLARHQQTDRLVELLERPEVIAEVPAPAVLRCAATLPNEASQLVIGRLSRSIAVYPRTGFTGSELILTADAGWNLPRARFRFPEHEAAPPQPEWASVRNGHAVRFADVQQQEDGTIDVELSYPDGTQLTMTFVRQGRRSLRPVLVLSQATIGQRQLSFDAGGLPRQASLQPEWDVH